MTRNRSICRFRRSFADGDGVDDPAVPVNVGVSRAAHVPLRSQVVQQLFFQYAPRLNEKAAVDGLVGHAHALVVGILAPQPPGNLLGRPVQDQFNRNDVPQLAIQSQQAALRSQRRDPCLAICIMSAISRATTMADYLPTHRRSSSTDVPGYLPDR